MRGMRRPLSLDVERGLLEMEAGACWTEVIAATHALQDGVDHGQGALLPHALHEGVAEALGDAAA